ncbi:hypothetical protein P0F65_22810 [Sphingomonas sp. I4]
MARRVNDCPALPGLRCNGEEYRFAGSIAHPYFYEFRKDAATYLQFTGLAALSQWLLARVDPVPWAETHPTVGSLERPTFTIVDGATRHLLPVDTIDHICAAGNYVEVHAEGRALLHRATLTSVETELGDAFVQNPPQPPRPSRRHTQRSHRSQRRLLRQFGRRNDVGGKPPLP